MPCGRPGHQRQRHAALLRDADRRHRRRDPRHDPLDNRPALVDHRLQPDTPPGEQRGDRGRTLRAADLLVVPEREVDRAGGMKSVPEQRLHRLEKAFNLRFTNFARQDDLPTPRDMSEPIPSGNLAGWKIDAEKFNKMLDEYYDLHGWDRETSFPIRETLVDLGLENVADDLKKIGKLR